MAYIGNPPIRVSRGGTGATTFATSSGIVKYDGTNLVTSTATIDASNRLINNAQPAFLGYVGSNLANKTGNATSYTLGTDAMTELYDQGGMFNTNGTATAPVTGVYHFDAQVECNNLVLGNVFDLRFLLTGRTIFRTLTFKSPPLDFGSFNISTNILLAATNTCQVQIVVSGEAGATVGISGDATDLFSYFSGYLVC